MTDVRDELSWNAIVTTMCAEASLLAIASLEGQMDGIPIEGAAPLLHAIRMTRQQLRDCERTLERIVAEAMPEKKAVVGSLSLERGKAQDKVSWDHSQLAQRIAAASADERMMNEKTGEIESPQDAAIRVFMRAAAVSYYRVGELKGLGIDPDDVREKESGRWTVRFG